MFTLEPETQTDWKWKNETRYFEQAVARIELEWLYSDHRNRLYITNCLQSLDVQRMTLYNDKMVALLRRYNKYKPVWT